MIGLVTTHVRWAIAGAVVVALAAGAWWLDHRGYQRAMAECERRMEVQEVANREAVRLAQRELMRTVDQLQLENMERDDVLAELNKAAEADPGGDAVCLSPDATARLQSIR